MVFSFLTPALAAVHCTARFSFVTLVAILVVSCVGPTPYQKHGMQGGYLEQALGDGQFVFVFGANVYTEKQVASNGALRRAAEKALELGFPDFAVLKKSVFGFGRVMPDGARCHTSEIVARIPAAKSDQRVFRAADVVFGVKNHQDIAATIPDTQIGPSVPMPSYYKNHAISPPGQDGLNSGMWSAHTGMLKQQIGQTVTAVQAMQAQKSGGMSAASSQKGETCCDVIYNAGYSWKKVICCRLSEGISLRDSGKDITAQEYKDRNHIIITYPAPASGINTRVIDLGRTQ